MLSERLRYLLTDRDMTLEELSGISKVPVETIRNLLYQKAENPRLNTILALCRALDTPVESMVSELATEADSHLMFCYHNCSPHGKYLISLIAAMESELTIAERKAPSHRQIPCLVPEGSISDGSRYATCFVRKIETSCPDASFAVSMPCNDFAPLYCQDDILLFGSRAPGHKDHVLFFSKGHIYFRRFMLQDDGYALCPIRGQEAPILLNKLNCWPPLSTCLGVLRI